MLDLDDIADVIADAVLEATTPLVARIAELEARDFTPIEKRVAEIEAKQIEVGETGPEIITLDVVSGMVTDAVAKSVAEIELPQPAPAAEVDMEAVAALIDKAVSSIPHPQDGQSCDMDEVKATLAELVKGIELPVAKDGVGLADALIDADGQLVLTMTDGRTKTLSRVVGKDAEPIPPFTLDDFDIVPTDERTIEMRFTHGNECHTFELAFPVPVYRGVFSAGETYERGDLVTWGGSMWHCEEAKGAKPDAPDGGWKLAVKRGRDGKGIN